MPSNRRVKLLGLTIALIIISILYVTHSARQSDAEFTARTLTALQAQDVADAKIASEEQLAKQLKDEQRRAALREKEEGRTKTTIDVPEAKVDLKRKPEGKAEDLISDEKSTAATEGKSPVRMGGSGERTPKKVGEGGKWDVSGSSGGVGKQEVLDTKDGGDGGVKKKEEEKTEEEMDVDAELNAILKRSPIIIFSKSYCPHSRRAKNIFALYNIVPAPHIVELDQHHLGPQLQAALEKSTGRRTVPNVLISGKSIGGGDDVAALHDHRELLGKIKSMGGKRIMEAELKKD
ncbi:hypothetical protein MMC25_007943 [Agyrium rufum]|nr:hypothetical protein [Agyrium rufum]